MNIVVAGGTGFLGRPLVEALQSRGQVFVLTRDASKVRSGTPLEWGGDWQRVVAAADVVVNLAGEGIADRRWSAERKRKLRDSRLSTTTALAEAICQAPSKERLFVSSSAIGYYGERGDEILDERAAAGEGFLPELAIAWEEAAKRAEGCARVVIIRFGIVLAPEGGALGKMLPPFRLFVGGPMGRGRHWFSWIDRRDAVAMIDWAIADPSVRGTYNAVAPEPVRNREFARELGRALHRPSIFPVPPFVLRLLLGSEMAEAALLSSQRVVPARAEAGGFEFHHGDLRSSLGSLLGHA